MVRRGVSRERERDSDLALDPVAGGGAQHGGRSPARAAPPCPGARATRSWSDVSGPSSPQQPRRQVEPARDRRRPSGVGRASRVQSGACASSVSAPSPVVDAGEQDPRRRGRMGEERCAARPEPAVGEREHRLVHALQPRVDALDDERPVGVVVHLGHVAAAAPLELVREQLEEALRAAAELEHTPAGTPSARRRPRQPSPWPPPGRAAASRCPAGRRAARTRRRRRARARRRFPCAPAPRTSQRAESALSVRPISTCLASLVTRGSARPAVAGGLRSRARRPRSRPARPAPRSRSSTAASSSRDPRLRRIGPLRLGDQVDLAPVQPLRDDLRRATRGGRASATVAAAAASSAASSSAVASRRLHELEPALRSALKTSEPRLTHRSRAGPGPAGRAPSCPSTLPTCVPVTTTEVEARARTAPRPARAARPRRRCRSGTAVPSQSKTTASKRRSSPAGRRRLRFARAAMLIGIGTASQVYTRHWVRRARFPRCFHRMLESGASPIGPGADRRWGKLRCPGVRRSRSVFGRSEDRHVR